MSNYDNLLREKENNLPLDNSGLEKHWAAMEMELNSAIQSTSKDARFTFKKIIKGLQVAAVIGIIVSIIFTLTKNKNQEKVNTNILAAASSIKPPMPAINVGYEIFTFDADKGDTLFTQNGSILIFPKNALLNNKGEIVTGKIEIKTREFNDPLDYYMAGIPMNYDSAGVKYTFVSSGMIDIKAYANNELLFVNPNAKPQLNLVSTNTEKNTNLYILDTTTGQWINKGKDEVNDVVVKPIQNDMLREPKVKNNGKNIENNNFAEEPTEKKTPITKSKPTQKDEKVQLAVEEKPRQNNILASPIVKNTIPIKDGDYLNQNSEKKVKPDTKPLPPQRASGKNPTLEILIDPASFKELLVYNNLKFEVLNTTSETVSEDSKTEWDNVELLHDGEGSNYIAKFSKGNKSVQYKVKPVLEGKDYDVALNTYNEKIKTYYDVQKKRIINEQMQQDTLALRDKIIDNENKKTETNNEIVIAQNKKTEIENKRIEELNVLIIERNKLIKRSKKILDSLITVRQQSKLASNLYREQVQKTNDSIQQIILQKINPSQALNQNLLRSFTIDGFGYWNCDQPTYPNGIPLFASFVDENNYNLKFANINAASFGINRILAFYNNNITVLPNTNHIIWGIYNNDFYYLTFKEYEKLTITSNIKSFTFKLNKYRGDMNSIIDLKRTLYGG